MRPHWKSVRFAPIALVASSALLLTGCGPTEREDLDVLEPVPTPTELRVEIDAYLAAGSGVPTTVDNVDERADFLWRWGNAYADAGGVIPVHLTQDVFAVVRTRALGDVPTRRQINSIQALLDELTIKDEEPDVVGDFEVDRGPYAATEWTSIQLRYTVGSRGIEPGGGLLIGRQLQSDSGRLQTDQPDGDNYLTASSSRAGTSLVAGTAPLSGMHGGFRAAAAMPSFIVEGEALQPGDVVKLTFGDRSGGSRGFRMQTHSTDELLFPVYVSLDADGPFLTPPWPGVEVLGGPATGLTLIAPSNAGVGAEIELVLRREDLYTNRATSPAPAVEILLDDVVVAEVPAGAAPVVRIPVTLEVAGTHRFVARATDGSFEAQSNPIWCEESPALYTYWGETHGHTGFAEGQGSPRAYYEFARDDAALDFASLSEHDLWVDDAEWRLMQRLTREFTEQGEFVAYLGYEWTSPRALGGHHNVFFLDPDAERVAAAYHPSLPELYRGLHERYEPEDVLIIPHAHQLGDWTTSDPDLEKLVEIYSMHGTFEWFGNLYLESGFEVGFIAASDDHRARPGYAMGRRRPPLAQTGGLAAVLAPEKTDRAIFEALRNLSAYATSDAQRILLHAELNGNPMGTRQEMTADRSLAVKVSGTYPIDAIDIIKNGDLLYSQNDLSTGLSDSMWLQVGFESSSDTFGARDNPRPYRIWKGKLRALGATIEAVEAPGFRNVYIESATLEDDGTVSFHTETRGALDAMLLQLEGASEQTVIEISLEESTEYGYAPILVRPPATIPAEIVQVSLGELSAGRYERELSVDLHTDRIHLQAIDPGASLDSELTFTDFDDPQPGDYYYVRVRQLDGSKAWSSPFWVGSKAEE